MKIIVGSKNPIKIEAVERAIRKVWSDAEIFSFEATSKVSDQPKTNKEAIEGAINRAKDCLSKNSADMAIGIESCIYENEFGVFVSAWAVAIDKNGNVGIGSGGGPILPQRIVSEIKKGRELGPIMDEIVHDKDTKKKQGTIGILTGNILKRIDSLEFPVICALSRFINPDIYN